MKLVAAVFFVAVLLVACSTDPPAPPPQPSGTTTQEVNPTATIAPTEAPVAATTPTAPPSDTPSATAATETPTPTATPEPPAPAPTSTPVPVPAPTPTVIHTLEINFLKVAVAEIPDNLPNYDRHDWKHWTDADGDCQDARNEVLVAESRASLSYRTDRRCHTYAGEWSAPYSGTVFTDPRRMDVDHMAPLGNAHVSGA